MNEQRDEPESVFRRPERPALDVPREAPPIPRPGALAFDPHDRPAPVVTEAGTFGTLPEDEPLSDLGDDSWLRTFAARIAAFALFVVAATWLLVLSAHQVTDRPVAIPALERGVAALTEIDALLATHREAMLAAGVSRAAEPDGRVELPGFPVTDATLSAEEARDLSIAEQRTLMLERAAEASYARGVDAFRLGEADGVAGGGLSTEGFARRLLSTLTADRHALLDGWLRTIGLVAIALAAAVVLLGRGFGRFGAVAVTLFGAAVVGLGATLVLRLLATLAGGDGTFASEFGAIAEGLAWTPARNAVWFATAGAAIAIPALLGGLLLGKRDDHVRGRAAHDLDAKAVRPD